MKYDFSVAVMSAVSGLQGEIPGFGTGGYRSCLSVSLVHLIVEIL